MAQATILEKVATSLQQALGKWNEAKNATWLRRQSR